jgi:hypothetical protein
VVDPSEHNHPQSHDRDESTHYNTAPVQTTRIEFTEKTVAVIALIFACVAFVTALWSIHESSRSATETRLLEQQVMDQNALLVREGLREPTDHTNGPAGNVQYQRKEK